MDKGQAIHKFWAGFGIPAYDEESVPDDAKMPYITYNVAMDSIGNQVPLTASIWYHSTSWAEVSRKAEEIAEHIVKMHPISIEIDTGRIYITKGSPFAQRMADETDTVKRIYLICNGEYLTNY